MEQQVEISQATTILEGFEREMESPLDEFQTEIGNWWLDPRM